MQLELETKIIERDGKIYRCVRLPESVKWGGRWEFLYKGKWFRVVNFKIKVELNNLL